MFLRTKARKKVGVMVLEALTDGQRSYDDKATRFGVLLKQFDAYLLCFYFIIVVCS